MVESTTTSFTTALLQTELLVRVAGVVFAVGVLSGAAGGAPQLGAGCAHASSAPGVFCHKKKDSGRACAASLLSSQPLKCVVRINQLYKMFKMQYMSKTWAAEKL